MILGIARRNNRLVQDREENTQYPADGEEGESKSRGVLVGQGRRRGFALGIGTRFWLQLHGGSKVGGSVFHYIRTWEEAEAMK